MAVIVQRCVCAHLCSPLQSDGGGGPRGAVPQRCQEREPARHSATPHVQDQGGGQD